MDILVDYSNLPRADRSKGPTFVVDRIIAALGLAHLAAYSRVSFRLYDGWYENNTPTRRAQDVSAAILKDFPAPRTVTDGSTTKTLVVNVELAYSLRIDPSNHLWHTHRLKGTPWSLSCAHPTAVGCTTTPCELLSTHVFLSTKKCPGATCTMTPANLISRSEQKLVDAMLSADLYYHHLQKTPKVTVVSSDDDMWPAIKTVLHLGVHVVQVHTVPGHTTPAFYSRGPRPAYTELHM
jgi:hypothetical protein